MLGTTIKTDESVSVYTFESGTDRITGYAGSETIVAIPAQIGLVNVERIGQDAFKGKESITNSDSIVTMQYHAFDNSGISSLTLGNSLKTIEIAAFQNNKLTEVTITTSVTSLGENAFLDN